MPYPAHRATVGCQRTVPVGRDRKAATWVELVTQRDIEESLQHPILDERLLMGIDAVAELVIERGCVIEPRMPSVATAVPAVTTSATNAAISIPSRIASSSSQIAPGVSTTTRSNQDRSPPPPTKILQRKQVPRSRDVDARHEQARLTRSRIAFPDGRGAGYGEVGATVVCDARSRNRLALQILGVARSVVGGWRPVGQARDC